MDCPRLETFRNTLHHDCFTRAADTLCDLADALLTDTQARSVLVLGVDVSNILHPDARTQRNAPWCIGRHIRSARVKAKHL